MDTLKKIYNESFKANNDNQKVINDIIQLSLKILSARIRKMQSAGKLISGKRIKFNEERFHGKNTTEETFAGIEKKYGFQFKHETDLYPNDYRVIQPEDWKHIGDMIAMFFNNHTWSNVSVTIEVIEADMFYIMFDGVYK